jgi:hypothetical protein
MSVKAQLSYDFIVASFIFLLVVSVLLIQWTRVTIQIDETRYVDNLAEKAYSTSDAWFREGVPRDWDETNVISLGLQDKYEFNQTKMDRLTDIGYENIKALIGIVGLDYFFEVYDENNNTCFSFGLPPTNSMDVVKVKRIGILNDTFVFLDTVVWK